MQQTNNNDLPEIHVDADACPVQIRRTIEKIARRHKLNLILYIDDSHELYPFYGKVKQVSQGSDAVDYVLANQVRPGDIVVTQDYGLAALALSRKTKVIHPSGMIYSEKNIEQLLAERHLASVARAAGNRFRSSAKNRRKPDYRFADQLESLILPSKTDKPDLS